ncbi:MAG: hypothetical protein AAGF01_22040 [Cyanobacteria bacterium P01_G01_bin.38]
MKSLKKANLLILLVISVLITLTKLTPVNALEIPAGLESQYQEITSGWQNPLLPASIPFEFVGADASVSDAHYLLTIDINEFQSVAISGGEYSKRIDTLSSSNIQLIELSNQITGYFLPAGETDEEPPELSFLVGDINYYAGGWVSNLEDLIFIANSMIENQ